MFLAVLFIETDVSHKKLQGFQSTVGKKKKKTFVFPFKAEYMRTKVILSQNKKVRSKF